MDIKTVLIVGSGAMGSGIAYVSAANGYNVILNDISQEILDKAMDRIRYDVMRGIDKGKLDMKTAEALIGRIKTNPNLEDAAKSFDLMIEAVFENMDVKKEIFKKVDAIAPEHALLASNTSTLSITELASVTNRPEKVLGLHFFNPPAAMKLVEVIKGEQTSDEVIEIGKNFATSVGKTPVVAKDSPGFIVNRILVPVMIEAVRLLEAGVASKEDIDKAMTLGANMPVGPLTLADAVGLDVALAATKTLEAKFGECYSPPKILVDLVEQGHLGMKSGKGFYEYSK